MEINFEGLEMLKPNISIDRARSLDEKNWFISHCTKNEVFRVSSAVSRVIRMSKMAHFL